MDFRPAIEKTYSHISTRPDARHGSTDSNISSPIEPDSHHDPKFGCPDVTLAPITTQVSRISLGRNVTRFTTHGTTYTSDPSFEVDWEDGDPENPRNWPLWYKCVCIFFLSFSTLIVVLYSTAYTSALGTLMEEFHINDKAIVTLGLTTYLVGLAVGSIVLAPISETYGRKPVYVANMFVFVILIIPCATATNITTLVVVRFFGAVAGSVMIANAPGSIGDIVAEDQRAIAFSWFALSPMNGPVIGPLIGGYVTQYLGWRWLHWIILILSGIAFVMVCTLKETYAPTLLQRRATKIRKETGENRHWTRFDVKVGFFELMKVNLSRPVLMAVKEPICIFWNVYIGIVYAILYLCFASYPIIYHQERGWTIGQASLAFVGIGVGNMITISGANLIKKWIDSHKPDETGRVAPESMMTVVCAAAVLIPIGQIWFSWTCLPASIHPAISIAAGIPFGMGNCAVFIYATNYLVGSYGIYAASALAGNSVVRSILGGVLPLAAAPMYAKLGANWAGTLLVGLEILTLPIPFIFYRYGHRIRKKSALISSMRELEDKQERKKKRAAERTARLAGKQVTIADPESEKSVTSVAQEESELPALMVTSLNPEQQAAAELSRVQGFTKEVREEV